MYFKFEGDKNISFALQDSTKDSSFYQMAFYGDLSKYSPLLNEQLPSNPEDETNIINNFTQKYSGASPYLKTNGNTKYTVDLDLKEENGNATLRFAKNDRENTPIKYASLNNLVIGTSEKSASVEIDYSYNSENNPNYAQTLAVGMLEMQNKESQLTIKAGQTLVFGTTNIDDMNINEILEEDWEMGETTAPKLANVEAKVETTSKMAIDSRRATSTPRKTTTTTTTVRPVSKTRVEPRVSALRAEQTTTEQELKIEIANPEINESKIEKNLLDASEYSDDVIEQSKYSIATEHPTRYYNGNKQNVQENVINVNPEDVIGKTEDKNKTEQEDDFDDWD